MTEFPQKQMRQYQQNWMKENQQKGRGMDGMNKCYYRIIWENYPSDKTPLNEQNLNKIDVASDEMDNRIISLDATKLDKADAQMLVKYIEYDENTGIFKITHYNGASYTIDTLLEKLAINFDYDYQTQRLIIELSDGTVKYVDLSALLTQYEFLNSDTVAFTVDNSGKVTASVKEGSIEEKHLRPNYLADIKVEAAKAEASKNAAATSEANAKKSENAADASKTAAKESEDTAAASAQAAAGSATTATQKATEASNSASTASQKATDAANSADSASTSAATATSKATTATSKATAASKSATAAATSATAAESYARGGTGTRTGEDTDNSKYYAEKAKESADKAQEMAGGSYLPTTTKYAASNSVGGNALNSDKVDGYHISVVSALPSDAASHTDILYIVTG